MIKFSVGRRLRRIQIIVLLAGLVSATSTWANDLSDNNTFCVSVQLNFEGNKYCDNQNVNELGFKDYESIKSIKVKEGYGAFEYEQARTKSFEHIYFRRLPNIEQSITWMFIINPRQNTVLQTRRSGFLNRSKR